MQNQAIQLIECKNILALQFRFKKLEKKEIYQKSRKLAICMHVVKRCLNSHEHTIGISKFQRGMN